MLGSSLGSSVIDSPLVFWVLESSLKYSVLVFQYAVCHQLHQELEGFLHWFFVLNISIPTDVLTFFGKFNVITGNLDKFLTRLHPRFLTGFWIGCIQKFHPQVFQKIGLVKFLEKCPWRSSFQKGYRSNIGLFHRCYPVKQLLLIL